MKIDEILAKHNASVHRFVDTCEMDAGLESDLYEYWFDSMPHSVYDDASEWISEKLADCLGVES